MKTPPDLLITDLVMPSMNGKDLADAILKEHPEIKILYTSGYADKNAIPDHDFHKDENFIQKPYSVKTLAEKVRYVLDKTD